MSEEKVPTSFEDFRVGELRKIADKEFAVEVGEKANKQEVLAALAESGVTFEMYKEQHPELQEAEAEVEDEGTPVPEGVVTAAQMQAQDEEPVKVVVKEEVPLYSREEWLIKMDRSNPLYEVRGHRFTQQNPYALVSPEDAEYLLTRETGFRQATPSELREFYG